jgi:uncharacterized protein
MENSFFDDASLAYDDGDYNLAFALFLKSAHAGDVDSMTRIASMYSTAEGVALDFDKSIEWDEKAAQAGSISSITNLGITYRMRGDLKKAKIWFEKANASGDSEAALHLAKLYLVSELETERVKHYLKLVLSKPSNSEASRDEAKQLLDELSEFKRA